MDGTTTTFEPTGTLPDEFGAAHQGVPNVQALHLKCSCRAELKLTDYNIPDALNYAKEWWRAHKDCS